MPDEIQRKTPKFYSLLELSKSIENIIRKTYTSSYWVKAEIAKLNYYPQSGHCYPDLVQKQNGKVVAQLRATIWSGQFAEMTSKFKSVTKEVLGDGMTVLFRVKVGFSAVYGLSLHILDIDPSFTLGELAREKQETIDRLMKEGLFFSNKQLVPPLLIQRLAIISVETSKGYNDFLEVITKNEWGYKFFHMLFPALLQGEGAISSIVSQLNRIKKISSHFDSVLIIRGGGGDVGLSSFDNYSLAHAIATFPIPVITGIGHSTNLTVSEQVSFVNKITPTEVGYYLLQRFHNLSVRIQNAEKSLVKLINQAVVAEKQKLSNMISSLNALTVSKLHKNILNIATFENDLQRVAKSVSDYNKHKLQKLTISLATNTKRILIENNYRISSLSQKIKLLHPDNILRRGYSITIKDGNIITNSGDLQPGEEIETIFFTGKAISKINKIKE